MTRSSMVKLSTALPIIDGLVIDDVTRHLFDECRINDCETYHLHDGDGKPASLYIEKKWEGDIECTANKANERCCGFYSDGVCHSTSCLCRKQGTFKSELTITLNWIVNYPFVFHSTEFGATVWEGLQDIRKQVFDYVFK